MEKPFVPANRWALVIGTSNYGPEIGRLRYTSKEAGDFAETLTGKLGFDPANVKLLRDGAKPDQAPTSKHILQALDALLSDKHLDKANLFVFYFSGHGVATPKGDFLLPSDVSKDRIEEMGVPVKEVIQRIVQAGLKNVLFIADACRSGTENKFGSELVELCRRANLAVILGCEPGKRSYEYPSLKSGVFTHFLIQDLASPDLRDASGSLWASRVGQEIRKQVHDYTEPDYGKFAQTPALWAEQSTLDILLGVYPQKPVSDLAVQSFKQSVDKLGKDQIADAMQQYAFELTRQSQFGPCVEVLKTVDQLGELTPAGRFVMGIDLLALDREAESSRILAAMPARADEYYRDLAVTISPARDLDPKTRMTSAMRILQNEPAYIDRFLAWGAIEKFGTLEQQLHAIHLLQHLPGLTPRQRADSDGTAARLEGRWKDAIANYERALSLPGTLPEDQNILIDMLPAAFQLDDPKVLNDLLVRAKPYPNCLSHFYLQKASLAQEAGDDAKRVEYLRKLLAAGPAAGDLLEAAKVAGKRLIDLRQEFKAAAAKYPYSWKAGLVLYVISLIEKQDTASQLGDAASLYRDDELRFNAELYALVQSLLEERVGLEHDAQIVYHRQMDFYFLSLLGSVPKFGYDADLWTEFIRFGMNTERNDQLRVILDRNLRFTPNEMPIGLRPLMLVFEMNSGDEAAVRELMDAKFEPVEGDNDQWLYAMYLAVTGHEAEASKLWPKLGKPGPNLIPRVEAMKSYLYAESGNRAAAKRRLAANHEDDMVVGAFDGLAWAALGNWQKAEPLLEKHISATVPALRFVSAKALSVLDTRYRATGRLDKAREIAHYAEASQPGGPLFRKFTFAARPSTSAFEGTTTMDCAIEDDALCAKSLAESGQKTYGFGRIAFSVDKRGNLAGSFNDEAGNVYPFRGTVDPYGNVTGSATWKGRHFKLAAKIAPPAVYKSFSGFKDFGQVFEFIDEFGLRDVVTGEPGQAIKPPAALDPTRTGQASR